METQLPDEGFRSALSHTENLTKCEEKIPLCFVFRVIRSVGMMGLLGRCVCVCGEDITDWPAIILGGVANWIFILLLFWRVPFLIGRSVSADTCNRRTCDFNIVSADTCTITS